MESEENNAESRDGDVNGADTNVTVPDVPAPEPAEQGEEAEKALEESDKVLEETDKALVEEDKELEEEEVEKDIENNPLGHNSDVEEGSEKDESQLPTAFIDEDSVSRSSVNSKSARDETEAKESDNQDQGARSVADEELSLDAASLHSEVQINIEKENEHDGELAVCEEINDSISRTSPNPAEGEGEERQTMDLLSSETMDDDTNDGEDLVTEVDISAMMELNMEECESDNPTPAETRAEPEIISLDSDDDDDANKKNGDTDTPMDSEPVVVNVPESVFRIDEDENITELDVTSMMQVQVDEGESQNSPSSSVSRRPRRAAAEAAVKTIHKISAAEQKVSGTVFRHRRKSQEDTDFDPDIQEIVPSPTAVKQNKCHVCKKLEVCSIQIRQYGADIHLCSNSCFNRFRNQGKDCKSKTLPCSKCSLMEGDGSGGSGSVFYWETMNFCSELCVGRYQMDVGSKCCTCGNAVSWFSLGKYCVRFGSDIRQFCNPQCLEGYKKNARVCFNCQLDIRRVGNIVLANIPQKNTPKEFCSNDCVEMYCDRNMHQPTRSKPVAVHPCVSCQIRRPVFRELVLSSGNFRTCSESCWSSLLSEKTIAKSDKCEMCAKFVNMDLGFTTPVFWLSSSTRIYGFCSHVCKNLFILNSRKILSCVTCKVKKYNYDLIEFFTNSLSTYAVCSLACLPKSPSYLKNIQNVIFLPQPTSDGTTLAANLPGKQQSVPVISAVSGSDGSSGRSHPRKQQHVSSQNDAEIVEIGDDDDDEEFSGMEVKDSDNILDIFTLEELEEVLKLLKKPKVRDVQCSAKPFLRTIETQTDVSELNEMCRIPYLGEDREKSSPPVAADDKGDDVVAVSETSQNKDSELSEDKNVDDGRKEDSHDKMDVIETVEPSVEKVIEKSAPSSCNENSKEKDETEACPPTLDESSKPSSAERRTSSSDDQDRPSTQRRASTSSSDKERSSTPRRTSSSSDKEGPSISTPAPRSEPINEQNLASTKSPQPCSEPVNKVTTLPILTQRRQSTELAPIMNPIVQPTPTYSGSSPAHPPQSSSSDYSHSPSFSSPVPAPSYHTPAPIPQIHPPTAAGVYPPPMYSSPPVPSLGSPVPPTVCPPVHPPVIDYGASACVPPTQFPHAYPYSPSVVASSSSGISPNFSNFPTPPPSVLPPTPVPVAPVIGGYGATTSPLGRLGAMTASASVAPPLMPPSPSIKNPRVDYALRTWKNMFGPSSDPVYLSSMELSSKLCELIKRGCKPNGERFQAGMLLYISLGIQQILRDNKRADKVFYDHAYYNFVIVLTECAERELAVGYHASIEEIHFWESSELGASSPGVLLFSLIYMFQKCFGLKTWEMQASLCFHNIVVQSRYDQYGRYIKHLSLVGLSGTYPTEIPEDVTYPDRCLVKLYEFYCFKNEVRDGPFYKCLRQDYTPRTPWFTNQPLDQRHIYQMLVRATMIKGSTDFNS